MGTWGTGIFENDDAADWVYTLEAEGALAIDAAFNAAIADASEGYLKAPVGSCALAAAEAVAAAFGAPAATLLDEVKAAGATHAEAIRRLPDVQRRAIRAAIAVTGKSADGRDVASELIALWGDDGVAEEDFQQFMASVKDVAVRIKGTMEGVKS